MAQEQKGRGRPKFHWWLAEQCYVLVDEVERQNKPITRRQAIYKFLEGPKFANLVVSWEKGIEDIKQNHRDILRDYQSHDDLEDTKKYMIECDSYQQVKKCLEFGSNYILLDNMKPVIIKKCLNLRKSFYFF